MEGKMSEVYRKEGKKRAFLICQSVFSPWDPPSLESWNEQSFPQEESGGLGPPCHFQPFPVQVWLPGVPAGWSGLTTGLPHSASTHGHDSVFLPQASSSRGRNCTSSFIWSPYRYNVLLPCTLLLWFFHLKRRYPPCPNLPSSRAQFQLHFPVTVFPRHSSQQCIEPSHKLYCISPLISLCLIACLCCAVRCLPF